MDISGDITVWIIWEVALQPSPRVIKHVGHFLTIVSLPFTYPFCQKAKQFCLKWNSHLPFQNNNDQFYETYFNWLSDLLPKEEFTEVLSKLNDAANQIFTKGWPEVAVYIYYFSYELPLLMSREARVIITKMEVLVLSIYYLFCLLMQFFVYNMMEK